MFRSKVNLFELRESRRLEPRQFAHMVSHALYEKRFGPYFTNPIMAGLDSKNEPFLCGFDSIGCIDFAEGFIVSGTASDQLYGMCEALYEPNLGPDDLFETVSQVLLNAVDRDAMSGWGAIVYIVTPNKVIKRTLRARQD